MTTCENQGSDGLQATTLKFMIELCYVIYKINDFARWACEQRRCGLYNFNGNCKLYNFRQSLLRFSQIVPLCHLNNNTSSKRRCGFFNFNGNRKNYRFPVLSRFCHYCFPFVMMTWCEYFAAGILKYCFQFLSRRL